MTIIDNELIKVNELIKSSIDDNPNEISANGYTSLICAITIGIQLENIYGLTALRIATIKHHHEIIELILETLDNPTDG